MTDDPLKDALARLAQTDEGWLPDGAGAAREIAPAPAAPGDLARAVLTELADTILPAHLTVSGPAGRIVLATAARRLQGIIEFDASLGAAGSEDLAGRPLDTENPGEAALLGDMLATLQAGGGPLLMRTDPAPRLGAESDPGLSSRNLSQLWGLTVGDPSLPPVERFLALASEELRAAVHLRHDVTHGTFGDADLEEPLLDLLDTTWPEFERDRAQARAATGGPTLTGWQQADGTMVAVAHDPGAADKVALVVSDADWLDLLAIWGRIAG